jgi:hypothetical protein
MVGKGRSKGLNVWRVGERWQKEVLSLCCCMGKQSNALGWVEAIDKHPLISLQDMARATLMETYALPLYRRK